MLPDGAVTLFSPNKTACTVCVKELQSLNAKKVKT